MLAWQGRRLWLDRGRLPALVGCTTCKLVHMLGFRVQGFRLGVQSRLLHAAPAPDIQSSELLPKVRAGWASLQQSVQLSSRARPAQSESAGPCKQRPSPAARTWGQGLCGKVVGVEPGQQGADDAQAEPRHHLGADGPVGEHLLGHHEQVCHGPQPGEQQVPVHPAAVRGAGSGDIPWA